VKIEKLRLRGFIGIEKGLGLNEVEIDLSDLTGLVALEGPNGVGKSTCLESMTPYRMLASRSSGLKHHVFLRDSCRELSFWYAGDHYRTLVKIDCDSDRSEGYIWKNGKSEIDGKVTNYDAYIKELLGSPTLFFNSVFCAQNSKKISDLTTGKLKELFSEFLRLDRLVAWEATCKQCIGVFDGLVDKGDRSIESLKVSLEALRGLEERKEELTESLEKTTGRRAIYERELEEKKKDLVLFREKALRNEHARQKVEELRKGRSRLESKLIDEEARGEKRLAGLREKTRSVVGEMAGYDEALKYRDEILKAAERELELVAVIGTLEPELENQLNAVDSFANGLHENREKLTSVRNRLKLLEADRELSELKAEVRNCRGKMADLEKRDPECVSTVCSFIKGALDAEKMLPELKAKWKEREAFIEQEKKVAATLIADLEETEKNVLKPNLKMLESKVAELKSGLSKSKAELKEVQRLSAKKSEIQVAMSRLNDLVKKKDELVAEGLELKRRLEEEAAALQLEISGLDVKIEEVRAGIDGAVAERQRLCEGDIERLEKSLKETDEALFAIGREMAVVEKKEAEKARIEEDLKKGEERKASMVGERSEWIYLRNACSKDGLRALEIDSVAPVITSYANELLSKTFGGNYSVKFRTQDDEGREVLDILLLPEAGPEVLLDNLSGGEKVWILKALRLAMTLISKEKSARNYKTIFADEEDGALSTDNAKRFIEMYRGLMKLGDMETCFYVSHRPEAVALADYRLVFNGGGIEIG